MRTFLMILMLAGSQTFAMAHYSHGLPDRPVCVPEIGAGSAASASALLSGTLLVIRGRRRK